MCVHFDCEQHCVLLSVKTSLHCQCHFYVADTVCVKTDSYFWCGLGGFAVPVGCRCPAIIESKLPTLRPISEKHKFFSNCNRYGAFGMLLAYAMLLMSLPGIVAFIPLRLVQFLLQLSCFCG